MKDSIRIKGKVTVQVFDQFGKIKRKNPGFLRRLFKLPGRLMVYAHHNTITTEGAALIADALLEAPNKAKVTGNTGHVQVGTGWTGNSPQNNTRCNNPTGTIIPLDNGYPALMAAWGNVGANTLVYRATFTAGTLNVNGINESALLNGNDSSASCMAYAQLTPTTNVTSYDTLQVVWELTILAQ